MYGYKQKSCALPEQVQAGPGTPCRVRMHSWSAPISTVPAATCGGMPTSAISLWRGRLTVRMAGPSRAAGLGRVVKLLEGPTGTASTISPYQPRARAARRPAQAWPSPAPWRDPQGTGRPVRRHGAGAAGEWSWGLRRAGAWGRRPAQARRGEMRKGDRAARGDDGQAGGAVQALLIPVVNLMLSNHSLL